MAQFRVSADIGGTFTDIVVQSSDGGVFIGKVPTTPLDPATGVVNGLRGLVPDLSEVGFFVHGTTVGLNAFLERRGERVIAISDFIRDYVLRNYPTVDPAVLRVIPRGVDRASHAYDFEPDAAWRARWRWSPRCCCWTNPSARSIPASAPTCTNSSAACGASTA